MRIVGVDVQLFARRRAGDGVEDDAGGAARPEEDGAFVQVRRLLASGRGAGGDGGESRGRQGEQVAFDGHDRTRLDEARDRLAQATEVFLVAAEGLDDGL